MMALREELGVNTLLRRDIAEMAFKSVFHDKLEEKRRKECELPNELFEFEEE